MTNSFCRRKKQAPVARERHENKAKNTLATSARRAGTFSRITAIVSEIAKNEYASSSEADR